MERNTAPAKIEDREVETLVEARNEAFDGLSVEGNGGHLNLLVHRTEAPLENLKAEKRAVQKQLHKYESEFQQTHGHAPKVRFAQSDLSRCLTRVFRPTPTDCP